MKTKRVVALSLLLLLSFAATSCTLGPLNISFDPTPVPTPPPVLTATPVPTPLPVPTATPVPTPLPVPTVTPVPTPPSVAIPGIDTPAIVRGFSFLIYEVETMKSFSLGTRTTNPTAPYDLLISIKGDVEFSKANVVCDWMNNDKVLLEYKKDDKVEVLEWGICQSNNDEGWFRFFFATYKEGTSDYVLIFPDGQRVPLKNLIDKSGEINL